MTVELSRRQDPGYRDQEVVRYQEEFGVTCDHQWRREIQDWFREGDAGNARPYVIECPVCHHVWATWTAYEEKAK